MKRSFLLTLIALSVFAVSAHAQKRRTPVKPKPAAAESADAQSAPSYQDGQVVQVTICKGLPIPEGYVAAGETATSDCKSGAWILKRRGTRLRPEAEASSLPVTTAPGAPAALEGHSARALAEDSHAAAAAVRALRRMENVTNVGVTYGEYRDELLSLKQSLDELMPRVPDGPARNRINAAVREYFYANDIWSLMIRNGFDWVSAEGDSAGTRLMLTYGIEPVRNRRGERVLTRQLVMSAIWNRASENVRDAARALQD